MCSSNSTLQLLTPTKGRKFDLYLTGVEDNNFSFSVKYYILSSKTFEESLNSKAVKNLFSKPKDRTV